MSGMPASLFRTPGRLLVGLLLLAAALLGSGERTASAATTRTWLGGSGNNWSTAANWSPVGAPVNGDALIFPGSATSFTPNNDIPGLDLASIELSGTGYVVGGLSLTIDGAITAGEGVDATISAPIALGANMTITAARFSTLTISGQPLALSFNDLTVQGAGQVNVTGNISGFASITVLGPGALVFGAPTTYIGATRVTGGILALDGGTITTPGVTTVSNGGTFGGTGSTGALVFANALLYPGINGVPGRIAALQLALALQTTARFRLSSYAADGYDQLVMNGPVDLGNATLQLRWDSEPQVGDLFRLVTGATSLTGTFAGLPEGAIFSAGGKRFSITYKGSAGVTPGHDVVVTRLSAAPADLFVTASAGAPAYPPGAMVTLTVIASNRGPNAAPGVVISADLPAQLQFQSVSAPPGYVCATPIANAPGQVACRGGPLAAGASATLTIVARVATGASGTATVPAAVSSAADETASADNSTATSFTIASDARPYRAIAPLVASDK
jgi:uncharacterized repeat protein (TIGR01451 family)